MNNDLHSKSYNEILLTITLLEIFKIENFKAF